GRAAYFTLLVRMSAVVEARYVTEMNAGRSKFLVISRGAAWDTILSPAEIREMSAKFTPWFEQLNNEGKIEPGCQLGPKGKIAEAKNVGGYWLTVADGLDGIRFLESITFPAFWFRLCLAIP